MFPIQVVYTIEKFKKEVSILYVFFVALLIVPLFSVLQSVSAERLSTVSVQYTDSAPKIIASSQVNPMTTHTPIASAATSTPVVASSGVGTIWPIHGRVTTEFGVYHQPYQSTHTGIDISDGMPSGSTGITPFRDGTVIDVIHSSGGLGNHIIVDHGNGLTSVYGHMSSIRAIKGQQVKIGDTIGFEGNTGASTGTHLHFEVRINGNPVNPRRFFATSP